LAILEVKIHSWVIQTKICIIIIAKKNSH